MPLPFGLQELSYSGSGVLSSQLDSYSLAGHLIGWTDGMSTTYDLTDAQGTVLMSLSASAVQGEQLYGPYGSHRYAEGTLGTDKGYTGRFIDAATGLAYDHARYYLRHIGVFLSPDSVQGNAQGMDPYAYVGGNPETRTDPTGERIVDPGPGGGDGCPAGEEPVSGGCAPDPGSGGGNGGDGGGSNPQPGPTPTPPPATKSGCGSFSGGKMSVHACAGLSDGSCNPVCESDNEASAYFNEWASEANTYYRWFTIIADILGIGDVGGAVLTGYKGLAKLIQKIMSEEGIVGIAVAALTIETLIVADAYATIANAASQLSSLYTNQLSNTGRVCQVLWLFRTLRALKTIQQNSLGRDWL
jgi:RHS repeat-associated protein